MKAIVCGGRDFKMMASLWAALDALHEVRNFDLIITGGATGADSMAHGWAMERGVPVATYPAQWGRYGRKAGPLRNEWMLKLSGADTVIAFPGGNGTADMVRRGRAAVGVTVVELDGE